jgi:uncharacterized membrane protein YphA (DoxX/SURF4 family)
MRKISLPNIVAGLLSLIFIYAGTTKALEASSFYKDVQMYHLLTDGTAWYLAHYLPWLEIVTGIGLIVKHTRKSACILIITALAVFMFAISSAWARGLNIECGCFGETIDHSSYIWVLIRDFFMLLAALYLFGSASSGQSSPNTIIKSA